VSFVWSWVKFCGKLGRKRQKNAYFLRFNEFPRVYWPYTAFFRIYYKMPHLRGLIRTVHCETYTGHGCVAAVASTNGARLHMEDAHAVAALGDCDSPTFLVSDGHVSGNCSAWLAKHMLSSLTVPFPDELTLTRTFASLDEQYRVASAKTNNDKGLPGGATVALCSIRYFGGEGPSAYIAHVGDSRVLHLRDGKCLFATKDHKPSDQREGRRIRARGSRVTTGGRVITEGVDSELAMSRAFGDFAYKTGDLDDYVIVSAPDIELRRGIECGDTFLVACDGLFDEGVLQNETVATMAKEGGAMDSPRSLAEKLIRAAQKHGSADNISVIVIKVDGKSRPGPVTLVHEGLLPAPFPSSLLFDAEYTSAYAQFLAGCGKGYTMGQYFECWFDAPLPTTEPERQVDVELRQKFFGEHKPPEELIAGERRVQWFQKFYDTKLAVHNTTGKT